MIAMHFRHRHRRLTVLSDADYTGGTKAHALPPVLQAIGASQYVYATPAYGYAQIALARVCSDLGLSAVIFVAQRAVMHPRTVLAATYGATIVQVPHGYLNVVQCRAREYAATHGAYLLPFGMDFDLMRESIASYVRLMSLPYIKGVRQVWSVAGSGTLTRALQQALPQVPEFHAVRIGAACDVGAAVLHAAPEPFAKTAKVPPPFASCPEYDAKAWRFIMDMCGDRSLFWNVG